LVPRGLAPMVSDHVVPWFMRLLRPSRGSFGQSVSQKGKA
jgi:hypothetical protein